MFQIRENLIGQKFNNLTVLEYHDTYERHARWKCHCDCGKITIVHSHSLKSGKTTSCGCSRFPRLRAQAEAKRLPPGEAGVRRLYKVYKYNAIQRGIDFTLTKEEFKQITSSNCYYCSKQSAQVMKDFSKCSEEGIINGTYIYNGIDRVNSNKGYTIDNVVPACKSCNVAKFEMSQQNFYKWLKQAYEYSKSQSKIARLSGCHLMPGFRRVAYKCYRRQFS